MKIDNYKRMKNKIKKIILKEKKTILKAFAFDEKLNTKNVFKTMEKKSQKLIMKRFNYKKVNDMKYILPPHGDFKLCFCEKNKSLWKIKKKNKLKKIPF